jgi:8-oxo-dGTP diphosphatase
MLLTKNMPTVKVRNTNIIAAFLVLIKGDKILLSLRQNTGYRDGYYTLVSGHVERGEAYSRAIMREAKEEAGITLSLKNLQVVHVMHRKSDTDDSERVDVFFTAKTWKGTITNMELDKCGELKWFKLNKLSKKTIPFIRRAIKNVQEGIFYSEFGW